MGKFRSLIGKTIENGINSLVVGSFIINNIKLNHITNDGVKMFFVDCAWQQKGTMADLFFDEKTLTEILEKGITTNDIPPFKNLFFRIKK